MMGLYYRHKTVCSREKKIWSNKTSTIALFLVVASFFTVILMVHYIKSFRHISSQMTVKKPAKNGLTTMPFL